MTHQATDKHAALAAMIVLAVVFILLGLALSQCPAGPHPAPAQKEVKP